MDTLSNLGAPLLALLGTLAVALIGLYQWRKQYRNPARSLNAEGRRKAYEGLWQELERINLILRETQNENPPAFQQIRKANTYFLQNTIHFDDADQVLVNDYIAALDRLRAAVYTGGDDDVTHAWLSTMAEMPVSKIAEIQSASEEVTRLRTLLKQKVQRVVSVV
jgi:hypothetical protein